MVLCIWTQLPSRGPRRLQYLRKTTPRVSKALPKISANSQGLFRFLGSCVLKLLRNKILPAVSVNKGCHSHRRLQPPPTVSWWALRELRKETKNTCHRAAIRLQPRPKVSPEQTQDLKTWDTGPRELRRVSKEWLRWAQILASCRKALNSLIWDT